MVITFPLLSPSEAQNYACQQATLLRGFSVEEDHAILLCEEGIEFRRKDAKKQKQDYPGYYLDLWGNLLQGKDEEVSKEELEELKHRIGVVESKLRGQDTRIHEIAIEFSKRHMDFMDMYDNNKVGMNVFSDFKEEVKKDIENLRRYAMGIDELTAKAEFEIKKKLKERLGE
jgi:hypothetical protein